MTVAPGAPMARDPGPAAANSAARTGTLAQPSPPGPEVRPPTGDGRRFERHAFVCTSPSSCGLDGAEVVQETLKGFLKAAGAKERLRVNKAGCLGQCGHGPLVVVYPEGVWYSHVTPGDAKRIWDQHMVAGHAVEDLLYITKDAGTNVIPKRGGPVTPDNPIDKSSPFWSPCTRCPADWQT